MSICRASAIAALYAISEALATMQPLFVPARWLYALPGLRQLADWVYQWVADNRYRFPGHRSVCGADEQRTKQTQVS